MIEPRGIVAASADSIRVNVPYATGVNCSLNTATFAPIDSLTLATAVYAGYVWRDTTAGATNAYQASGAALSAGLSTSCTAVSITPVPNGLLRVLSPAIPTTTAGAPILLYQTVTYRFAASTLVPGRIALWRRVNGGASEEVAVPVGSTSRFRFYVSGGVTAQDSVPSPLNSMTGVELVLGGESERISPGTGAPESANTRVSIFFRNAEQ